MATSQIQIGGWAVSAPAKEKCVAQDRTSADLSLDWDRLTTEIEGHRMQAFAAGSGRPLVLVHGLLGTARGWLPAARHLARSSRVYAIDALGIGESDRVPDLDATLSGAARRLTLWMDQQNLKTIDLVGTSHGGAVAMCFAGLYPERVRHLVLSAPANPFCLQSQPQILFSMTPRGRRLARIIPHAPRLLHAWLPRRMYGDPKRVRRGSLDEYIQSLRVPGTVDYLLSVLSNWNTDMDGLRPMLERVRAAVPTLLLWGDQDRAVSLGSAFAVAQGAGCAAGGPARAWASSV